MTTQLSIREYLTKFDNGDFDSNDFNTQCAAGWYDWFCSDSKLAAKTKKLTKKLKEIVNSEKIDQDKHYVWFKNNCPMDGELYDDFRIADLETGDVIFTIIPASGHTSLAGVAEVWGQENGFDGAIVEGTWDDVKRFFMENGK